MKSGIGKIMAAISLKNYLANAFFHCFKNMVARSLKSSCHHDLANAFLLFKKRLVR